MAKGRLKKHEFLVPFPVRRCGRQLLPRRTEIARCSGPPRAGGVGAVLRTLQKMPGIALTPTKIHFLVRK